MMSEQAIRDDEVREEVQAVHQRFVDAATRIVAQGIAEGSFRDLDPIAVAQLLKAIIDGLAGQSAIGVRPDAARLSTSGIQVLLGGLLRSPAPALPAPSAVPAPPASPPPPASAPSTAEPAANPRLRELRERMKT
jgi:hypothetical protein